MVTKKIKYENFLNNIDPFAALGIFPKEVAALKHSDIEDIANEFRQYVDNQSRKPGQQPVLSGLWGERLNTVSMVAVLFKDAQRFNNRKQAWLKHNKPAETKLTSAPVVKKKDPLTILGFSDNEIPKLTPMDIVRVGMEFENFSGPRDRWGYKHNKLFFEDWKEIAEAIAVLDNPARLELHKKNWLKDHNMPVPGDITFVDRLQDLINREQSAIEKGLSPNKFPVLAKILEDNNLTIAGKNVAGMSLRNVDCSDVDFSGTNLSSVNMRKAKVARATFNRNTIINNSTKLDGLKGADKAVGLVDCLEANLQSQSNLKNANPDVLTLFKNLGPKKPKAASPQNDAAQATATPTEKAVQEKTPAKKRGRNLNTQPIGPILQDEEFLSNKKLGRFGPLLQDGGFVSGRKLGRYRKKKRVGSSVLQDGGSISALATIRAGEQLPPSAQLQTKAASLPDATTSRDEEIARELDELARARREREETNSRNIRPDPELDGHGIDLDSWDVDAFLAELDEKPKAVLSRGKIGLGEPGEERNPSEALGNAIQEMQDNVARLVAEHPDYVHLIAQKLREAARPAPPQKTRRKPYGL